MDGRTEGWTDGWMDGWMCLEKYDPAVVFELVLPVTVWYVVVIIACWFSSMFRTSVCLPVAIHVQDSLCLCFCLFFCMSFFTFRYVM